MKDIINRIEEELQKIESKEEQTLDDYTLHDVLTDASNEIMKLRKNQPTIMNLTASEHGCAIGEIHGGLVINK